MPDPIIASDFQKEKPLPGAGQALPFSPFEGDVLADQKIEPHSSQPMQSKDREKNPDLWNRFFSLPFLFALFIVLGCSGLLPLLMLKPGECGRFAFGLTLYRVGETRAEYDGQCQGSNSIGR